MMEWTSEKYKNNLMEYEKRDGIKAIIIYCLIMGSAFFHGWLYTTNTSVLVLNLSLIYLLGNEIFLKNSSIFMLIQLSFHISL